MPSIIFIFVISNSQSSTALNHSLCGWSSLEIDFSYIFSTVHFRYFQIWSVTKWVSAWLPFVVCNCISILNFWSVMSPKIVFLLYIFIYLKYQLILRCCYLLSNYNKLIYKVAMYKRQEGSKKIVNIWFFLSIKWNLFDCWVASYLWLITMSLPLNE